MLGVPGISSVVCAVSVTVRLWNADLVLLAFYFEFSCQSSVLLKVLCNERGQLFRCPADGVLCCLEKSLANCRIDECLADFCVQTGNDGRSCTARDEGALPGRKHEPLDACFLERWHVGKALRARPR